MENITLGTLAVALAFIVGLWGSIEFLSIRVTRSLKTTIQTEMAPLSSKLSDLEMQSTKNFLVSTLSSIEKTGWASDSEKQRFYEEFDHYEKMKGNGYIHAWVEDLKKQGKI